MDLRPVLLAAAGVLLIIVSLGPLQNVFSTYQDSPLWVYLAYGLPPLGLGVALLLLAGREWRLHGRQ